MLGRLVLDGLTTAQAGTMRAGQRQVTVRWNHVRQFLRSRLFLVHIDHFLGDEPNRPVIRSHGSRVIVVGMGERTGAGSVSIADRPFQGVPVGVAGE
jgi:hypothetical protein